MRICSLLPSNTEIIFALGLGNSLVGVTHECDYPAEVSSVPVVTSSVVPDEGLMSREIHSAITGLIHKGSSIYHLDQEALGRADPHLILTQELCEVCAVSYKEVKSAVRILDTDAKVVSLEPTTLDDILSNIQVVGDLTDSGPRAREVVAGLRKRIDAVASLASTAKSRPRVFCMEWLDPIFVGGHWVPQMVELAGGMNGLGIIGEPSIQATWQQVADFAPEILVLMPCGFGIPRTFEELEKMSFPDEWKTLPAVEQGNVFVVDGSSYFNRPGPRIVDGLELLAQIIHPELFTGPGAKFAGLFRVPYALR